MPFFAHIDTEIMSHDALTWSGSVPLPCDIISPGDEPEPTDGGGRIVPELNVMRRTKGQKILGLERKPEREGVTLVGSGHRDSATASPMPPIDASHRGILQDEAERLPEMLTKWSRRLTPKGH
jgi:hypothetical protein